MATRTPFWARSTLAGSGLAVSGVDTGVMVIRWSLRGAGRGRGR
jgi:hypothetical protein